MIFSSVSLCKKYDDLAPKLEKAMEFLKSTDLQNLEPGSVTITEGEITAIVMHYETVADHEIKFETHDRFVDIQYIISGVEVFGIADRKNLQEIDPYNVEKDITFYEDPEHYSRVIVAAGEYVTLFPEDGHKPKMGLGQPGSVRKVVIKVKI